MRLDICLLTIVLLACGTGASNEETQGDPLTVGDLAPDFTLKNADDQIHSLKKLRGKVIFLIMGNRKIRKENHKWANAFQKDYRGREGTAAYIIADMRSVPGFVPKGFIKKQLKNKKPPVTLLLDWRGEVHLAYRTQEKKPNLYLIGPHGGIVFHIREDFDKETYQSLKKAIDETQQSANEN